MVKFIGLIQAENTAIKRLVRKVAGSHEVRSVGSGVMELALDL